MVDKDNFYMEVVDLRTFQITTLPYEVSEFDLIGYANILLSKPEDSSTERFGTYDEIINKSVKRDVEEKIEKIKLKAKKMKSGLEKILKSFEGSAREVQSISFVQLPRRTSRSTLDTATSSAPSKSSLLIKRSTIEMPEQTQTTEKKKPRQKSQARRDKINPINIEDIEEEEEKEEDVEVLERKKKRTRE